MEKSHLYLCLLYTSLNTAYLDVVTELDKYADVESKIRELEVLHVETAVQSEAGKMPRK